MTDLSITILPETADDAAAIERLHERTFGPGRYAKTAYRLREGVGHELALSFTARIGTLLVGSVRLTPIRIGDTGALLLGPLTVEPPFRERGIGRALIERALADARRERQRERVRPALADAVRGLGVASGSEGALVQPLDRVRLVGRLGTDGEGKLAHAPQCLAHDLVRKVSSLPGSRASAITIWGRQGPRRLRSLSPLLHPKSSLPDFGISRGPKSGKPDFG